MKSNDTSICISGSAGTGKSMIVRYLLNTILKPVPVCLCAPTHKAALVLKDVTGKEAITLHSLLAMSPKLDVLELDFRELGFNMGTNSIPAKGVVICDEASMINDELYEFLNQKCKDKSCKIIYCGDRKQLQPVSNYGHSKVWNLDNMIMFTKIFRQNNESAIMPVLEKLREYPLYEFESKQSNNGSVVVTKNIKEFSDMFLPEFQKALEDKDVLMAKILAYTNARVDAYNEIIHQLLFNKDGKEFHNGGFLTCYENVERDNLKFWNSMDYIIVDEPQSTYINIPGIGALEGYILVLYDPLTKEVGKVSVLSKTIPENTISSLAQYIDSIRIKAIQATGYKRKLYWTTYFNVMDSFISQVDLVYDNRLVRKAGLKHGYACSVHKSQGSSYRNIFIDMKDIFKQRDREELRQLQYVALSRTRNNAYIFT